MNIPEDMKRSIERRFKHIGAALRRAEESTDFSQMSSFLQEIDQHLRILRKYVTDEIATDFMDYSDEEMADLKRSRMPGVDEEMVDLKRRAGIE
jgi:hypothetical protein